jgi:hypothetical protein
MAAEQLRGMEWREAYDHAEKSWTLRHSATAARLAFLASSAGGDFRLAALWIEPARTI